MAVFSSLDLTTHLSPLQSLCFSHTNPSVLELAAPHSPTKDFVSQDLCRHCSTAGKRGVREGASFGALLRCHFFKGTSRNAQRRPRLTAGHICVLCTTLSPPEMIYPVGLLALFSLWHRGQQTLGHGPRLAHHRFLYGLWSRDGFCIF